MPYGNKAGTSGWKSVGRQVRKGEKGLGIFAPIRRKTEDDDGNGKYVVVGFRVAHVFDVSQTDGEPLPEMPAPEFLEGDALDVAPLVDYAAELGFTIEFVDPEDDRLRRGAGYANGVTNYSKSTILVRNDTSPLQTFKTTVHELGHASLHKPFTAAGLERPECQGRVEVEAESVAYVVAAAFGLDTSDYSFGYVAGWAANGGDKEPSKVVAETGQRVVSAAHKIIEALERSAA
jgi:antirestriction protein ArdC